MGPVRQKWVIWVSWSGSYKEVRRNYNCDNLV